MNDPVSRLRFHHHPAAPEGRLRLSIEEDRTWLEVKLAWAAPSSHPGAFLAALDSAGDEIALIEDLTLLDKASQDAVRRELWQKYLVGRISRITHVLDRDGDTYWSVETDRGKRDFITRNLHENAQWMENAPIAPGASAAGGESRHLLLIDVDGNRFEIPDVSALDGRSRTFLEAVI